MTLYGVDTETFLIKPGLLAPPLVCVSLAWRGPDGEMVTALANASKGVWEFERRLDDPDAQFVLHNAAFDMAVLCARAPRLIPKVFRAYADGRIKDTKVRQELKDIATGRKQESGGILVWRNNNWVRAKYTLAALELLYFNRDRSAVKDDPEAWRKRYGELAHLPVWQWPKDAQDYAIEDATGALEVYEAQGGAITDEDNQCRAAWALHLMSTWGIRTDGDMVPELEAALLAEQQKNKAVLKKAGFLKPKRASAEEVLAGKVDYWEPVVKERLATKKDREAGLSDRGGDLVVGEDGRYRIRAPGDPRPMRWARDTKRIESYVERVYGRRQATPALTESGRIATDKDTLYQSGSRLLKLVADGGGVDKILSTYVPVLKQGTAVPINARFNVLVNSGRTSSSEPNLQNLPTGRRVGGVRECFVPRPGFLFISADYNTLELCALAQVCLWLFGRSRMAEVINDGRDLHSDMAAQMIGLSYEQVEANKKGKGSPEKRARDAAKVANFGLPGGLGVQSLIDYARKGYGVNLDVAQATELRNAWLAAWPEMRLYFKYINDRVGLGEGRLTQFWSERVRGAVGYCDGCNTLFQGLAADGAKRAMFRLSEECYVDLGTPLFGSRPVAFIHDEFILEVPEWRAHEAAERLVQVMIEGMREVIPDVRIAASPALMTRWQKDADETRDDAGRLIPWAPKAA